ncbi:MAG: WYL domain-containing protein [Clostridia bacterium]|nr:WYL domain-containing protein [Clostridia bacterium]
MADSMNPRTRLVALVEIFLLNTDDYNVLSVEEIQNKLAEYGYDVNRRTVLADLKLLNTTPFKVVSVNKPKKGYFLIRSHSETSLHLIMEAIYSSESMSAETVREIEKNIRKTSCIPTFELLKKSTKNISPLIERSNYSQEVLHELRHAIVDRKRIKMVYTKLIPGDLFAPPAATDWIIVNPIRVAVTKTCLALTFVRDSSPDKLEFINLDRIAGIEILDETCLDYDGNLADAVNFFDGIVTQAKRRVPEWLFLKFKNEVAETVENNFEHRIEFKKAPEEGYCLAKVYTVFDERLVGWLIHMGKKIEIISPKSLEEYIQEKVNEFIS